MNHVIMISDLIYMALFISNVFFLQQNVMFNLQNLPFWHQKLQV